MKQLILGIALLALAGSAASMAFAQTEDTSPKPVATPPGLADALRKACGDKLAATGGKRVARFWGTVSEGDAEQVYANYVTRWPTVSLHQHMVDRNDATNFISKEGPVGDVSRAALCIEITAMDLYHASGH